MSNEQAAKQKTVGVKISTTARDQPTAKELASALQDIVIPTPDAVTIFCLPEQTWQVEAYYGAAIELEHIYNQLQNTVADHLPDFEIADVPERNWVALSQTALPPVHVGRFRIYGRHDRDRISHGPGAIHVEAGEAFGTAHHATTSGCLEALEQLAHGRNFRNILDLGCGTGLLSIAASRCWPRGRIHASDIDPKAIAVANQNIQANGFKWQIQTILSEGMDHPKLSRPAQFDLIVANILAKPLIKLAPTIARTLAPSGTLVLSGLLTEQAQSIIATYRSCGLYLKNHLRRVGWSTLILRRANSRPIRAKKMLV